jgi:hypothetical protein
MRNLIMKAKSLALAGVAGAMLLGGAVSTSPAEAGASTGTWRYASPYRGYGHRGYGYRGGYGYHGYGYRGGYGYRPYYRRGYGGGAVAAGVATGLALGVLGAAATAPAYGYAPACYWTRQGGYDAWGNYVVHRVQVCD